MEPEHPSVSRENSFKGVTKKRKQVFTWRNFPLAWSSGKPAVQRCKDYADCHRKLGCDHKCLQKISPGLIQSFPKHLYFCGSLPCVPTCTRAKPMQGSMKSKELTQVLSLTLNKIFANINSFLSRLWAVFWLPILQQNHKHLTVAETQKNTGQKLLPSLFFVQRYLLGHASVWVLRHKSSMR